MNGTTLRVLRELQGATQRQIALQAHVSPSTLSLLENELTPLDTPALARILGVLKYTPAMDSHFEALVRLANGHSHDYSSGGGHDQNARHS